MAMSFKARTVIRDQVQPCLDGRRVIYFAVVSAMLLVVAALPTRAQCPNFKWGSVSDSATGPSNTRPFFIVSDDFNGDGKADLAVANTSNNSVTILIGRGDGTFIPPTASFIYGLASGAAPKALVIGDFNQDNKPDIAIANGGTNNVAILLNNGNGTGTFQLVATTYSVGTGNTPRAIATADLNGDHRLDLVVLSDNNNSVAILKGRNNNSATLFFAADTSITLPSYNASAVVIADYDGDNKLDLAVLHPHTCNCCSCYDHWIAILPGIGDGTFLPYSAGRDYATNSSLASVNSMKVGLLNADGFPDLVVTDYDSSKVSVLLNDGTGGFPLALRTEYPTIGTNPGNSGAGLAVADIDGDGKLDIVTANYGSNNITVFKGNGTGSFTWTGAWALGNAPSAVLVTDLDGTGGKDVVVANNWANCCSTANSVSVLLNANSLPEITQQPIGSIVYEGYLAHLSISVSDTTSYQWQANGVNLSNGPGVSGATTANLTLGPVSTDIDGVPLTCVVGNACGAITSNAASLIVTSGCRGDMNHDGFFNALDIQIFVSAMLAGDPCPK